MESREYKKILLVRTDRLGDVILTTPAIKAIRNFYPDSHIAMLVRPYTEGVVKGNSYLDEVIVYDKYGQHKSIIGSIRFALELKRKAFDMAIIFHPTNRMHIIAYLTRIPRRIGYHQNFSFLLTDSIENTKHEGKKHERDYNFDILEVLGIRAKEKELYLPLNNEAKEYVTNLLSEYGITGNDRIVIIHPGASCASKIWPHERFAKLADKLIDVYGVKIIAVSGKDKRDLFCIDSLEKFMQKKGIFLRGSLDVQQLAALLKKALLFISNDSGPVHVSVAVKTPVLALFGRNQPGLGPTRWGPLGPKDIVIHKDVGCGGICLAHNCKKSFECLRSISSDEVLSAIKEMGIL
ncbi:MAG: glycosyltransferase family 9 protein [Candidatus Omnitrophica bacterium]|nr:glycosyltransferase family 9 protein [Candidatus Omnitrophota bacterium]